jgi:hypothetical protein
MERMTYTVAKVAEIRLGGVSRAAKRRESSQKGKTR